MKRLHDYIIYMTPHFAFRGLHSVGRGLRWPCARGGVGNTWAEGGHLCLESSLSSKRGLFENVFFFVYINTYIQSRHVNPSCWRIRRLCYAFFAARVILYDFTSSPPSC